MTSTLSSPVVAHRRLPSLQHRWHVVAPALRVPEAPPAAVFAAVRRLGPVARDHIATLTGLSIATVNRQVSSLLEAGLLRERPDLAVSGAIGRPRIPIEVNHEPYLTLGLHIGARVTSVVVSDLFGRTLNAVETPTPCGSQTAALQTLAEVARRCLARWNRRRPLWTGVAIGGGVDSVGGYVDHPRLGWSQAPVGTVLGTALGLPVSVASHVDAMAGAELLLGTRHTSADASSLYVYARETVGFALVIGGRVHTPASGPGTVAGIPVQSALLGGDQLESAVSDEAVIAAARRIGLLPPGVNAAGPAASIAALLRLARQDGDGPAAARGLLVERARVLGGAIALLRDLLNPDDLVVGGQAFSAYPEALPDLRAAFSQRSVLAPRDVNVTVFGNRVQEAGAGMVSLSSIYADPLGALRRVRQRRSGLSG